MQPDISERKEKLLIGSNLEVVAELDVFEGMQPQTVTVPIEGCEQLKDEPRGMGFCHIYWSTKRAALARRGIEWRSPSVMNPRVMFD